MAEESEGQDTGAEAAASGVEPAADGLTALWRRLKDHRVAQWSVGYIAVAYGIQHAVTLTAEAFDWSHEITRISMLALVLGLPVVMALAWYHGERANRRMSGAEMTIIAILLAIGSLLFYVYARPAEQVATSAVVAKPTIAANAPTPSGVSVAVLPFLNLSGDPKEEYFSDGMTEEITSALANIKELKVVARTSAFQFKGENRDMRAIGQALGATDLIEGSVRRDGNKVRITAQLIKVADGTHLWTNSYDRELKDVFAVQEDIAQAIAGALQIPLGLRPGEQLVSNRTTDTDSYQDYLRALTLYRARNTDQAINILEHAVAKDPNYAPAWALLAETYDLEQVYGLALYDGSLEQVSMRYGSLTGKAEQAARQALHLDPRSAGAYSALAQVETFRLDWDAAAADYHHALAIDPNDPDILHIYSTAFLAPAGYTKQALIIRQKLHSLEPLVPVFNIYMALILMNQGQNQAAIDMFQSAPAGGPTGANRNKYLAIALATAGRYGDAADALLAIPPTPQYSRTAIENAARYLRTAPKAAASPNDLPDFQDIGFVYAFIGAPDRSFEYLERVVAVNGETKAAGLPYLWSPAFAPIRKTERFKVLMRKAKLVDYWRAHNWPDLCHPTTGDDFACN